MSGTGTGSSSSTTTRSTDAEDTAKLKHACVHLLGINSTTYDVDPLTKALKKDGVLTFSDFVSLSEQDIMSLSDVNSGDPLPLATRRKLVIVLAFYQVHSCQSRGPINIKGVTKDKYDAFRIGAYNSNEPILPWNVAKPGPPDNLELASWRKNLKPSKSDFKEFRNEALWQRYKERTITTLEACGLAHTIDSKHVSLNPDLDSAQVKWVYKVFQDTMTAPTAKTIVTKHITTMDARTAWKEICEFYDNSMTAQI